MADLTASESAVEPGNLHLFREAQTLLSKPPRPSDHPTDSFWMHTPHIINEKALESTEMRADGYSVVVVGGGLTGLSTAFWLTENGVPGDQILIIEAREIGGGATGRNGGHCWPSSKIWDPKFEEAFGRAQIKEADMWKYKAADEFMTWLEKNNIDCDLVRTGCCSVTKYAEEVEYFNEFVEAKKQKAQKMGVEIEMWSAEKCAEVLHSTKWKGGLYQSLAGQFWPRKAALGIAKLLLARGVHIRTKTLVSAVDRQPSVDGSKKPFLLLTGAGNIRCNRLAHATCGYSSRLIPALTGAIVPVRGQIVVSSPVEGFWIPHNMGFNDGHEYLVHRKSDKRIVFGGMRWRASTIGKEVGVADDSRMDEGVSDALRTELLDLFPELKREKGFKIEYEWSGIMGFSADYWPLIGKVSDTDDEWIASGFSGNGMPQCFGAGKAIAEMMTGKLRPEDWISLFDPRRYRNPTYAAKWRYNGSEPLRMDE